MTLVPSAQTLDPREAVKAQKFCGEKLFIAADSAASGAEVECYHIPGTICQVNVKPGTYHYGDLIIISSTAGVGEKSQNGTATVGMVVDWSKEINMINGPVNVILVENKTMGVNNADSNALTTGAVCTFSGGYDTDGFSLKYPNVKAALYGDAPCGVLANNQSNASTFGVMHHKPGEIVRVQADSNRIDAGDWLVPSAEDEGTARSGTEGIGIGYAMESKASGASGYSVDVMLAPYGKGPKNYLYYQGDMCGQAWNKTFNFYTEGSAAYTTTRMTNSGGTQNKTASGTGSEEVCIFARLEAINVSAYSKMVIRFGYTTSSLSPGSSSAIRNIWYGLSDPTITAAKQSTIESAGGLFSGRVYSSITPNANQTTLTFVEYELDISSLTNDCCPILFYAQDNIGGSLSLYLQYIYLM